MNQNNHPSLSTVLPVTPTNPAPNKTSSQPPATPDSLKDQYVFQDEIGHGAQGKVYTAIRKKDNKIVVIKQLNISSIKTWKDYELFNREATILEQIDIPGVAKFYDAVECLQDEPPCSYIVQEYIGGASLQKMISDGHRFRMEDVYDIIIQTLEILNALHHHDPQVIHRDIKPSNLMITLDEENHFHVTIIDFGAVANPQVQGGGSTVAGTYGYMPPEQLMGKPEPASDVYAVAALAVQLFCGKSPADIPTKSFRLIFEPEMQDKPHVLITTLRQMLEPNVTQRLQNIPEIIETFRKYQNNDYLSELNELNQSNLAGYSSKYEQRLQRLEYLGSPDCVDLWNELPDNYRAVPESYKEFILNDLDKHDDHKRRYRLDENVIKILSKGRKSMAIITNCRYYSLEHSGNEVDHKKDLYIINERPLFEITYKFNPPDDFRTEDIYHTFFTHTEPEGHYNAGDPLPILYTIDNFYFYDVVSSIPYPVPIHDLIYNISYSSQSEQKVTDYRVTTIQECLERLRKAKTKTERDKAIEDMPDWYTGEDTKVIYLILKQYLLDDTYSYNHPKCLEKLIRMTRKRPEDLSLDIKSEIVQTIATFLRYKPFSETFPSLKLILSIFKYFYDCSTCDIPNDTLYAPLFQVFVDILNAPEVNENTKYGIISNILVFPIEYTKKISTIPCNSLQINEGFSILDYKNTLKYIIQAHDNPDSRIASIYRIILSNPKWKFYHQNCLISLAKFLEFTCTEDLDLDAGYLHWDESIHLLVDYLNFIRQKDSGIQITPEFIHEFISAIFSPFNTRKYKEQYENNLVDNFIDNYDQSSPNYNLLYPHYDQLSQNEYKQYNSLWKVILNIYHDANLNPNVRFAIIRNIDQVPIPFIEQLDSFPFADETFRFFCDLNSTYEMLNRARMTSLYHTIIQSKAYPLYEYSAIGLFDMGYSTYWLDKIYLPARAHLNNLINSLPQLPPDICGMVIKIALRKLRINVKSKDTSDVVKLPIPSNIEATLLDLFQKSIPPLDAYVLLFQKEYVNWYDSMIEKLDLSKIDEFIINACTRKLSSLYSDDSKTTRMNYCNFCLRILKIPKFYKSQAKCLDVLLDAMDTDDKARINTVPMMMEFFCQKPRTYQYPSYEAIDWLTSKLRYSDDIPRNQKKELIAVLADLYHDPNISPRSRNEIKSNIEYLNIPV